MVSILNQACCCEPCNGFLIRCYFLKDYTMAFEILLYLSYLMLLKAIFLFSILCLRFGCALHSLERNLLKFLPGEISMSFIQCQWCFVQVISVTLVVYRLLARKLRN